MNARGKTDCAGWLEGDSATCAPVAGEHPHISEVGRVLSRAGKAIYVIGENTLRGVYIRTSIIVTKLAELAGLSIKDRRIRTLPANRRYMPPPSSGHRGGAIEARMSREVILTFAS